MRGLQELFLGSSRAHAQAIGRGFLGDRLNDPLELPSQEAGNPLLGGLCATRGGHLKRATFPQPGGLQRHSKFLAVNLNDPAVRIRSTEPAAPIVYYLGG